MAFENYAFIAGSMCQSGDRFLRAGYKPETLALPYVLREMGKRGEARGVELHHRGNETDADLAAIEEAMEEAKLSLTYLNAWTYGERKWRFGSLSAADKQIRKEAVERCKETIRVARRLKAKGVSLWLGQDGFDYIFQVDYRAQWQALVDSMKELCDFADGMPVSVEPKAREPRNRSLIDNVQTALLLRLESGRSNLGVTIDTGHVICGGQGLGASIEAAIRHNCLYNLHSNDNFGMWDDDMIIGSVRLMEHLETFYLLKKYGYDGFISVDIFPYREDAFDAVCESIRAMRSYDRLIEKMGVETIDRLIENGNVPETLAQIRKSVFCE